MGQGIQQAPVEQGGSSSSVLDVFKVLYEPTAVFERVRERPSFLLPFLVICAVQIVIYFVNMPFLKAGMAAQIAAAPQGGPDPSKFLWIGAVFIPVGIAIALVLGGLILWMLVSIFGGEGKFGTLLSVATWYLGTRADGDRCVHHAPALQGHGLHDRHHLVFDRCVHRGSVRRVLWRARRLIRRSLASD